MRSLSRAVVIGALAMPLAFAGAGLASADTKPHNSSKPASGHEQNWNGGQGHGWGQDWNHGQNNGNSGWNDDQGWNDHGQECGKARCSGHHGHDHHKGKGWGWDWTWVNVSDDDTTNVVNAGIIGGNNNFFSGNQDD